MMKGGVVPGGRLRNCTWLIEVTCATALATLTCGWKKILMIAMPFSDCDSICSMSLTVVVIPRSLLNTMRLAIWSAESPVYCQTTVTTGMSMFGKISVGIERML